VVRHGLPRRFGALDPRLVHQPFDPIAADLDAGALERQPCLAVAVGAVVALGDLLDEPAQPLVLNCSR
jgi:hypothetical protein